jgi:4-amino-4-deoxy-L-arabinose transferase-like glycosyltransferase
MNETRFSKLWHWLLVIPVLLIAFWLRSHALDQYPPGVSNDEAVNVVDTFHIHRTGVAPAYEDKGRPEVVYRILTSIAMWAWGDSVWTARLSNAMWSMLTLAAVYWLTSEAMVGVDNRIRRIASIVALIALAIMPGHITLSRALYRAIPQMLFVALSASFILRGLRTTGWHNFIFAGVFASLAVYTYPAAFFYPPALVILGISLFVLRLREWRVWLPRMLVAALTSFIFAIPFIYLYLTKPDAILARAQDVASGQAQDWNRALNGLIGQFLTNGDENPQYNVARAPIIPPILQPVFFVGLIALVIRIRKPSSWLIAAMLVLFTIPVLGSNEITHGLRISSEFVVVPVIVGIGIGTMLHFLPQKRFPALRWAYHAVIIAFIGVLGYGSVTAWQLYRDYWEKPDEWQLWRIFGEQLDHNEWFFRTDRRNFAEWLVAQEFPMLIPIEELNRQTTRAWLVGAYPDVTTAAESFELPENTHIVIPYALELGDLMRDTRQYALLKAGTITLLPPLSTAAHQSLLENIESGTRIEGEGVVLTFLGYEQPIPEDFELEFERISLSDGQPLAIFGNDEIHLNGWYGDTTLDNQESVEITLIWSPTRQLRHEYLSVLQLQTQDFQRVAGDDDYAFIQRWLYPSTVWQVGDAVPDTHIFNVPTDLPVGAYRLMAGVKYTNYPALQAVSNVGETVNNLATIGWLKVPQSEIPEIPDSAIAVDAQIADTFQLSHVEAIATDNGQTLVWLYWQSLVDRPALDGTIFVHATDANGAIVAQNDVRPWGGQYPTFIWDAGEIVVSEHLLATESLDISTLNLRVGMYTFPGSQNLPAAVNNEIAANGSIELGAFADYLP